MVLYAKDIVEVEFLSLPASVAIAEAAKKMRDARRGFVVIGDPKAPEGVVTEWDVLAKVVADGRDPSQVTLGEIMSRDIVAVDADLGLAAVAALMSEKGIRRLLVKKGDEVVGVITSRTMLARMNDYVDKVSAQISRLQTPWF
jgi:CBS domain-containing protein